MVDVAGLELLVSAGEIGNRVEAPFGEGVAAGKAAQCEPGTLDDAEARERYIRVLRAGGQVKTLRGADRMERGREDGLVEAKESAGSEARFRIRHGAAL